MPLAENLRALNFPANFFIPFQVPNGQKSNYQVTTGCS